MTEPRIPDLEALRTLTRGYAAFQARKSGLATALGGFLTILLFLAPTLLDLMRVQILGHSLLEYLLLIPFLWLVLKSLLARMLYRKLGVVRAAPDEALERRRWLWIFGLAGCLLVFQGLCILGFACGFLQAEPALGRGLTLPLWVIGLPLGYLLPTPWLIHGVEEARAYAVLVGLCLIWLTSLFLLSFGTANLPHRAIPGASVMVPLGYLGFLLALLAWSALAVIRGWREHREYLAILKNLPLEEA